MPQLPFGGGIKSFRGRWCVRMFCTRRLPTFRTKQRYSRLSHKTAYGVCGWHRKHGNTSDERHAPFPGSVWTGSYRRFFETDIFRSCLNAFGAFMRFRDVQFSLSRGIIPIHPEISLKIHSYRHCSKNMAMLFPRTLNVHYRLRVLFRIFGSSFAYLYPDAFGISRAYWLVPSSFRAQSEYIAALPFPR